MVRYCRGTYATYLFLSRVTYLLWHLKHVVCLFAHLGEMLMQGFLRSRLSLALIGVVIVTSVAIPIALSTITSKAAYAATATANFAARGNLDCNGDSSIQKPLRSNDICTDLRGFNGERGQDNGKYVGHDEPSMQFVSSKPGSGNN